MAQNSSTSDHSLVRLMSGKIIALGIALVICGIIAIASPAISTMAVTLFLGLVLAVAGALRVVQSFMVKEWSGFVWQLLVGMIELLGGILVYFNPMKGAIAITLVIALVLIAEGLAQLGLAIKMRAQSGVGWMFLSSIITIVVGVALAMRLPYDGIYTPGTLVGVSLLFAGWAYIAIALAARKAAA
ncbi:HdeD protein [Bosea sp. LC85]|uniref:HdeD family acid-resistance protein n=1 Tax=Bosea sp. LC85 TaxID=1502851 RepID=UPI0004E3D159|nr:HdeD family acid-resistance protein [Bosea sp. LC85]KFC70087.1 HdeD protein [Bosea sp. LC85]